MGGTAPFDAAVLIWPDVCFLQQFLEDEGFHNLRQGVGTRKITQLVKALCRLLLGHGTLGLKTPASGHKPPCRQKLMIRVAGIAVNSEQQLARDGRTSSSTADLDFFDLRIWLATVSLSTNGNLSLIHI